MPFHGGRRVRRLLPTSAVLAVAAGLLPATARADEAYVTTTDGRLLHVGTVVASGQRNGDICSFPDLATIRFDGSNTYAATLTAGTDCTLSVSKLTEIAARPLAVSAGVRPKYVEDAGATTAEPSGGVGIGPVHVGTGALPSPQTWQHEVFTVYVSNTVYDAAGLRQYQDHMQAQYTEEWNDTDERVRGLTPLDGACVGGMLGDVVVDPLTTIRNCWYRTTSNGYRTVGFDTGGWYRQGVRIGTTGVVTDERAMQESFRAWYAGWEYSCDDGPEMPVGWSSECWGSRAPY